MIKRLFRPSIAAAIFFLYASSAVAQSPSVLSEVDEIMASLSEITGWPVKHKVPSETLSREKFSKLVADGMKGAEKDKGVVATELTLKMFGLAPWDFNLVKESTELITEQAAAFYDYQKKRLFVLEAPPAAAGARTGDSHDAEDRISLAHELAHALADQQYPLHKYLEGAKRDDEGTARQAVIEGQASWLSWAYLYKRNGGSGEVPPAMVTQLADAAGAQGDDFPVLTGTPLYMRESLIFPYGQGMRFIDSEFRDLQKKSFDHVFMQPPTSTHDILHPDEYRRHVTPTVPMLPKLDAVLESLHLESVMKGWKQIIDGDVGEFDYSVMLRQYTSAKEGREVASHWRGGSYRLYQRKGEKYPILMHVSDWESASTARDFEQLYERVLQGKWKKMEVGSRTANEVRGTGDTGNFLLRINGASVECIEGLPGPPSDCKELCKL
ncbi:MAG: hypothetical protein ABI824_13765 [Acidobacteriota bacterium]